MSITLKRNNSNSASAVLGIYRSDSPDPDYRTNLTALSASSESYASIPYYFEYLGAA